MLKTWELRERDVIETRMVCPYCMEDLNESWDSCCGEAGHGVEAYITKDDACLVDEHTLVEEYSMEFLTERMLARHFSKSHMLDVKRESDRKKQNWVDCSYYPPTKDD